MKNKIKIILQTEWIVPGFIVLFSVTFEKKIAHIETSAVGKSTTKFDQCMTRKAVAVRVHYYGCIRMTQDCRRLLKELSLSMLNEVS